jgi:hypothetical protein
MSTTIKFCPENWVNSEAEVVIADDEQSFSMNGYDFQVEKKTEVSELDPSSRFIVYKALLDGDEVATALKFNKEKEFMAQTDWGNICRYDHNPFVAMGKIISMIM